MSSKNALHVIFGTGAIGMAIMDALIARGKQVRMVNRSGQADVSSGVEILGGDVSDVTFAKKAGEGAAVIYNTLNPPYDKWPELFPPLQANLIEAAASAGAKLVLIENTYMYGKLNGKPMTEDLPYAAHTRKGSTFRFTLPLA